MASPGIGIAVWMIFVGAVTLASIVPQRPHILLLTVDDWGWANFGIHRETPTPEVQTPNVDALARSGLVLNRHYAFMYCSPSRSALHSGRNPVHVNVWNDNLFVYNVSDAESGAGGIPRNMTGLAEKLALGGYVGHHIGKWHAGLATMDRTPVGRGFASSFGYLGAVNDYWVQTAWDQCQNFTADLWQAGNGSSLPAWSCINDRKCNAEQDGARPSCVYEETRFIKHALAVIQHHNLEGGPLFLSYASHLVHAPLQVPLAYQRAFAFIKDPRRALYAGMVKFLDDVVGNLTAALQARSMLANTLIVVLSDNGGPIYLNGTAGANNWPLRGGKVSNWEGGVRTNAFVAGGFLPAAQRGQTLEALVAIEDWYPTLLAIAGVDPWDARAAQAGLPPVDGLNQWPLLSGQNRTAPRTEVYLGVAWTPGYDDIPFHYDLERGSVYIQGVVTPRWKLLVGPMYESVWTGPQYPNATTAWVDALYNCGQLTPSAPGACLFDLVNDPSETNNVAAQHPDTVVALNALRVAAEASVIVPSHGPIDPAACAAAMGRYRGVIGPWVA